MLKTIRTRQVIKNDFRLTSLKSKNIVHVIVKTQMLATKVVIFKNQGKHAFKYYDNIKFLGLN